jgi:hypothetical protein
MEPMAVAPDLRLEAGSEAGAGEDAGVDEDAGTKAGG